MTAAVTAVRSVTATGPNAESSRLFGGRKKHDIVAANAAQSLT
jgi:hypothetical protein